MDFIDKILLVESFSQFPQARSEFMQISGYLQEVKQLPLETILAAADGGAGARAKLDAMNVRGGRLFKSIISIREDLKNNPDQYTEQNFQDYNTLKNQYALMMREMNKQLGRVGNGVLGAKIKAQKLDPDDLEQAKCIDDAHKAVMEKRFGTWGEFAAWAANTACAGGAKAIGYLAWISTNDKDVKAKWTSTFNKANSIGEMGKALLGYHTMTRAGRTRSIFVTMGVWEGVWLMKTVRRSRAALAAVQAGSKVATKELAKKGVRKGGEAATRKLMKDLGKGFKQGFKEMNPKEYKKLLKAGAAGRKKLDDAARMYAKEVLEKATKNGAKEVTEEGLKLAMKQSLKTVGKRTGLRVGFGALKVMTKILGPLGVAVEAAFLAYEVCSIAAPAGGEGKGNDGDYTWAGVDWGKCAAMFYHGIDHAGDTYDKWQDRKEKHLDDKKKSEDPKLTMAYGEWKHWPDDMQCTWCTKGPPDGVEGQGAIGSKPKVKTGLKFTEASGPDCIEVLSRKTCNNDASEKVLQDLKGAQTEEKESEDLKTLEAHVTADGKTGGSWDWSWSNSDVKLAKEHGSFPYPAFYPKTVRYATYRGGRNNDKVWIDFVPYNKSTEYKKEMIKLLRACISEGEPLSYKGGVIGHFYWNESGSMLSNRYTNLVLEMDGSSDHYVENKSADIYQPLIRAVFKNWARRNVCYVTSGIQNYFFERGRTQMFGSWSKKRYSEPDQWDIGESFSRDELINKKRNTKPMLDMNNLDKKIFDIINEEIDKEINEKKPLNEIVGVFDNLAPAVGKLKGLSGKAAALVKTLGKSQEYVIGVKNALPEMAKALRKTGKTSDSVGYAKVVKRIAGEGVGRIDTAVKSIDDALSKLKPNRQKGPAATAQRGLKAQRKTLVSIRDTLQSQIQNAGRAGELARDLTKTSKKVSKIIPLLKSVRAKVASLAKNVNVIGQNQKVLLARVKELETMAAAAKSGAAGAAQRAANAEARLAKLEKGLDAVKKMQDGARVTTKAGDQIGNAKVIVKGKGMGMSSDVAEKFFATMADMNAANARVAEKAIDAIKSGGKAADSGSAALPGVKGAKVTWTGLKQAGGKMLKIGTVTVVVGGLAFLAAVTYFTMPGKKGGKGGKKTKKDKKGRAITLARCADGKCGKATQRAIKAYQEKHDLTRKHGSIDDQTAKAMISDYDNVFGKDLIDITTLKKGSLKACKWVTKEALANSDFMTKFPSTEAMQTLLFKTGGEVAKQLCSFGRPGAGGGGGKGKKKDSDAEPDKKQNKPAKDPADPNVKVIEGAKAPGAKACAAAKKRPRPLLLVEIKKTDKEAWKGQLSASAKEQVRLEQLALSQYERENPNQEVQEFAGLDDMQGYLIKRFYLYSDGTGDGKWNGIKKLGNTPKAKKVVEGIIGKPGSPKPGISANFPGVDLGRDDNLDDLEDQLNNIVSTLQSNMKAISSVKAAKKAKDDEPKRQVSGEMEYLVYEITAKLIDPISGVDLVGGEGSAVAGPIPIFKTDLEAMNGGQSIDEDIQIDTFMFKALLVDDNVGLRSSGNILNPKRAKTWARALNEQHFEHQPIYIQTDFSIRELRLHPFSTGVENKYLIRDHATIREQFAKDDCGEPMPAHDGRAPVAQPTAPAASEPTGSADSSGARGFERASSKSKAGLGVNLDPLENPTASRNET